MAMCLHGCATTFKAKQSITFSPMYKPCGQLLGYTHGRHAYDLDNCFKLFLLLFMCRVTIESPWRWQAISCGQRIILEGVGWFWSAETPLLAGSFLSSDFLLASPELVHCSMDPSQFHVVLACNNFDKKVISFI
jgi:hypothetical protein